MRLNFKNDSCLFLLLILFKEELRKYSVPLGMTAQTGCIVPGLATCVPHLVSIGGEKLFNQVRR